MDTSPATVNGAAPGAADADDRGAEAAGTLAPGGEGAGAAGTLAAGAEGADPAGTLAGADAAPGAAGAAAPPLRSTGRSSACTDRFACGAAGLNSLGLMRSPSTRRRVNGTG